MKKEKIEVGDLLYKTYGYDCTIIEFFIVNKLSGKSTLEVTEVGYDIVEDNSYWHNNNQLYHTSLKVKGNPSIIKGESFKVRISKNDPTIATDNLRLTNTDAIFTISK